MCVLCGYGLSPFEWADAGPGGETMERDGSATRDARRARIGRATLCRAVLAPYGLDVRPAVGAGFVVRDGKGRSQVAQTLAEVWGAADALAPRRPDPLDPRLLEALRDG